MAATIAVWNWAVAGQEVDTRTATIHLVGHVSAVVECSVFVGGWGCKIELNL